jgi:hypothetical protein
MARINIEDSIFTDPKYLNLLIKVGDQYKALGLIVTAFKLAQTHWLKTQSIPAENWPKDLDILIDCGLAEKLEAGSIYVKGSKEQFNWLVQKSEAGKSNSEKKLNQLANARAKKQEKAATETLNGSERTLNEDRTELKMSEALPLSLSLTQDNNILNNNNIIAPNALPTVREPEKPAIEVVNENFSKIKKDLIESWADTYPKEYLEIELKKARSWLLANKHKAPKSNYGRFLNNWFNNGWEKYRKTLPSNQTKTSVEDLMNFMGWENE